MDSEITRVTINDDESSTDWVVVYHLGDSEFDDSFEDESKVEIVLSADDIDTAVKYAQQYLRKKQLEDESWEFAEILSVEMH